MLLQCNTAEVSDLTFIICQYVIDELQYANSGNVCFEDVTAFV